MTFRIKTTAATLALSLAAAPMAFAQETTQQTAPSDAQNQPAPTQDAPMQDTQTGSGSTTGDGTTGAGDADAAVTGDATGGEGATAQDEDFTDAELGAFARAVLAVAEVRDSFALRLQAAEDEQTQRALLQEANTEMRGAVEEMDGITVDRYVAISQAALTDQELSDRIATLIEAEQTGATGTEQNDQG